MKSGSIFCANRHNHRNMAPWSTHLKQWAKTVIYLSLYVYRIPGYINLLYPFSSFLATNLTSKKDVKMYKHGGFTRKECWISGCTPAGNYWNLQFYNAYIYIYMWIQDSVNSPLVRESTLKHRHAVEEKALRTLCKLWKRPVNKSNWNKAHRPRPTDELQITPAFCAPKPQKGHPHETIERTEHNDSDMMI